MNWTELLTKGGYPIFLIHAVIDGESANFVASSLAGNGILNIFLVLPIAVLMEVLWDTIYYSIGRKLPLQKILDRLFKTEKGRNLVKRIDEICEARPYKAASITKLMGPLAIPGLMYYGNREILKLDKFIFISIVIAGSRGALISLCGYMAGKGVEAFGKIYGTTTVVIAVVVIAIVVFTIHKALSAESMKKVAQS